MSSTAFPHRYRVELSSIDGEVGTLHAPGRPDLVGGPPVEFGGRDTWWSPEHLLVASAVLCTMSTFHAFAARDDLALHRCRCDAGGTVEKTPSGLAFTEIRLKVEVRVAALDVTRAAAILDRAKRHCLIANSLKCPVVVESDVSAASDVAAASP